MGTIQLWAGVAVVLAIAAAAAGCRPSSIGASPDVVEAQSSGGAAAAQAASVAGPTDAATASVDATVDVDAALADRARSVRSTLDADVPMRAEDGTYLLVGADRGALTPGVTHLFEQALAALYNGRFDRDRRPDHPIAVLLFASHEHYLQFAPAGSLAYYKRREAEIDVDLSWGTKYESSAVHELVHSLIDAYFEHAPLWLSECLATLYENPSFPAPGEIRGLRGGLRQTTFRAALRSEADEADMRLDALFTMDPRAFKGFRLDAGAGGGADAAFDPWLQSRNESLARYVCFWLQEKGWLWDFVHRFRNGFETDRSGSRAFEEVTGMSPVRATTPWIEFAKTL